MAILLDIPNRDAVQIMKEIERRGSFSYRPDNRIWREERTSRILTGLIGITLAVVVIGIACWLASVHWAAFLVGLFLGANLGAILMGRLSAASNENGS